MWQKIAALVLLMAVAGSSFNKVIVMLDYHFNQKYIAATLCENRNKPACCCHGKCFLKKQLQKDEDTGKNNLPPSKDKSDILFFCDQHEDFSFIKEINLSIHQKYLLKKYATSLTPVFHPPGKV
jgi:hypothetical protein